LLVITAQAQTPDFGYGPEKLKYEQSPEKIWREAEVVLPVFPEDSQLVNVPMPPSHTIKVYVDKSSLARGKDGVLRFSLVIESPSGARNVFFDGIRCETREYKTYAFGTHDRHFNLNRNAVWQFIYHVPMNGYQHVLYAQYACSAYNSARSPHEFLEALNLKNLSSP
jgi:hypothetical protein